MHVILAGKSGQLANRLIVFSHFIANALENGYPLFNPTFAEYGDYFHATRYNDFSGHRISVPRPVAGALIWFLLALLRRLLPKSPKHVCQSLGDDEKMDLSGAAFASIGKSYAYIFIFGWPYRDDHSLRRHARLIRSFFRPVEHYQSSIDERFRTIADGQSTLVGVHIRRGDYKLWCGGAYYFENQIYANKMAQIRSQLLLQGRATRFLVCSNQRVDLEDFQDLDCVIGTGHELEDLYLLARCDLLIGPPSTYSMWASFYGEVPLYHLYHADAVVDVSTFRINLSPG